MSARVDFVTLFGVLVARAVQLPEPPSTKELSPA
jgi:hypothetical protein